MSTARALGRLAALMALLACLVIAVHAVVKWWQGIETMVLWDWFWLGLFAPVLYVYLRYFSVLGCDSRCVLPDEPPGRHPPQ